MHCVSGNGENKKKLTIKIKIQVFESLHLLNDSRRTRTHTQPRCPEDISKDAALHRIVVITHTYRSISYNKINVDATSYTLTANAYYLTENYR